MSQRLTGQGTELRFEPCPCGGWGGGQVCLLSSFLTMLSSLCQVYLTLSLPSGPQALSHFGITGSFQGLTKSVDSPSHSLTPTPPTALPSPDLLTQNTR